MTRRENTPRSGDVIRVGDEKYPCCGKSTGHATWCNSTPRMLAGEAVTYTTVTRHVWQIETRAPTGITAAAREAHRWRCSCGAPGDWKTRPSQAEQGAKTHARRAR